MENHDFSDFDCSVLLLLDPLSFDPMGFLHTAVSRDYKVWCKTLVNIKVKRTIARLLQTVQLL